MAEKKAPRTPAQLAAVEKMRAAQAAKKASLTPKKGDPSNDFFDELLARDAPAKGDIRTVENPPLTNYIETMGDLKFKAGNAPEEEESDAAPEMFQTLTPDAPAPGLRRNAEKNAPKSGFRGRNQTVAAPDPEPAIEPAPVLRYAPLPEGYEEHPKPAPRPKAPKYMPSVILLNGERGLRVVYTYVGKGDWEVWYEAYETTETVHDEWLEHTDPLPGFYVEDSNQYDSYGDAIPPDGAPRGLRWVETVEETEPRRGYA